MKINLISNSGQCRDGNKRRVALQLKRDQAGTHARRHLADGRDVTPIRHLHFYRTNREIVARTRIYDGVYYEEFYILP